MTTCFILGWREVICNISEEKKVCWKNDSEKLVIKYNLFWVKCLVWQKALLHWLTHFYGHSNPPMKLLALSLCYRNYCVACVSAAKGRWVFCFYWLCWTILAAFGSPVGLYHLCQHKLFPVQILCPCWWSQRICDCVVQWSLSVDTRGELRQWLSTRARLTSCLCYGNNEVVGMICSFGWCLSCRCLCMEHSPRLCPVPEQDMNHSAGFSRCLFCDSFDCTALVSTKW